jgi:hypothetical protein
MDTRTGSLWTRAKTSSDWGHTHSHPGALPSDGRGRIVFRRLAYPTALEAASDGSGCSLSRRTGYVFTVAAGILPAVEPGIHPPQCDGGFGPAADCCLSLAPSSEERSVLRRTGPARRKGRVTCEGTPALARRVRAARCRPLRQPGWPPPRSGTTVNTYRTGEGQGGVRVRVVLFEIRLLSGTCF